MVIEVKIGEFDFQDLGQLSGYVVACNHILKKEGRDNPTIGLLICRQKDSLLAQYALEGSNLPLGISEYELSKLYPERWKEQYLRLRRLKQDWEMKIKMKEYDRLR